MTDSERRTTSSPGFKSQGEQGEGGGTSLLRPPPAKGTDIPASRAKPSQCRAWGVTWPLRIREHAESDRPVAAAIADSGTSRSPGSTCPEAKYASTDGGVRGIGWLERLCIRPRHHTTIGKETNKLDDVQAGLYGAADEILTEYARDDPELEQALAALARLSGREVQRVTGVDRRTIDRVRLRGAASPRVRAAIITGALAHRAGNAALPSGPSSASRRHGADVVRPARRLGAGEERALNW